MFFISTWKCERTFICKPILNKWMGKHKIDLNKKSTLKLLKLVKVGSLHHAYASMNWQSGQMNEFYIFLALFKVPNMFMQYSKHIHFILIVLTINCLTLKSNYRSLLMVFQFSTHLYIPKFITPLINFISCFIVCPIFVLISKHLYII